MFGVQSLKDLGAMYFGYLCYFSFSMVALCKLDNLLCTMDHYKKSGSSWRREMRQRKFVGNHTISWRTLAHVGQATFSRRRDIYVGKHVENNKLSRRMHVESGIDCRKLDNINFLQHIFSTHAAWHRGQRRSKALSQCDFGTSGMALRVTHNPRRH